MQAYDQQTLRTTTELAAIATVAYSGPDGMPRMISVTPLLLDGAPAFTLTYARSDLAQEILASPQAVVAFADSRLAYVGWSPLCVTAKMEVIPDPEGQLFRDKLLHQQLRKFPPDRQLIGSLLLQRENWWYMPRWIVRVAEAGEPRAVARRTGADHGILARKAGQAIAADTVRVEDWDSDPIVVEPHSDEGLASGTFPAALFFHDFAIPDMDPRTSFLITGWLDKGHLSVTQRTGSRELGKRPGLLARWRAQRDLERRCKAGLKTRLRQRSTGAVRR
jgi:hypothetical protein